MCVVARKRKIGIDHCSSHSVRGGYCSKDIDAGSCEDDVKGDVNTFMETRDLCSAPPLPRPPFLWVWRE